MGGKKIVSADSCNSLPCLIYFKEQHLKLLFTISCYVQYVLFVLLLCNDDFYYLLLFSMEVMKCGMYCSLFDVISKTKQGNCLSGLLHKMEKEKMVSFCLFFD